MSSSEPYPFVILEHDHPFLHWDLLLKHGNVLKAWRLLQPLALQVWIPAQSLPDHRTMYLTYEGAVSGGRGVVRRVTDGNYTAEGFGFDDDELANSQQICTFALSHCEFAQTVHYRSVTNVPNQSPSTNGSGASDGTWADGEWFFE